MYPGDKSISIGAYNSCLVICEDYRLTNSLEATKIPQTLATYEKFLTGLFPASEILTVACHSAVNYHLYALAKDGKRIRYKMISADTPIKEYGERTEEEIEIYAASKMIDGKRMFKSEGDEDEIYECTEDQLMEDFAFGVAKRLLGVKISVGDDEELMFETPFCKYKKGAPVMKEKASSVSEENIGEDKAVGKKPWWKVW